MPVQVLMPQLGESVNEGTITKWLKSTGEPVEEFEPLVEVNTDKVDSEIPSPAAGVLLEITAGEGTTVQAGALLAWIGQPGEATGGAPGERHTRQPAAPTPPQTAAAPSQAAPAVPALAVSPPAPLAGRDRDLGFISPVVARMAAEHGLDLRRIPGTGSGGRITKKDVQAYIESDQAGIRQAEGEMPAPALPFPPSPEPSAAPAPLGAAAPSAGPLPGEIMPLSTVRRAIADHMVLSKHTSPHVTTVMEVDLSRVAAHREANKAAFARDGVNLTFTAYFVAAAVAGLRAYPIVNSSWDPQGILYQRQINIGMAASLGEEGLIVPVIKGADGYSLLGLARTINDLAGRARAKKLQPDEVKGGTFTITNHGTSGSLFATPIINQPQCAILGVGAIQKRVVVISDKATGDAIAIRPMAYLTLTFDHRILDGAIADYFLGKVVETLQQWK